MVEFSVNTPCTLAVPFTSNLYPASVVAPIRTLPLEVILIFSDKLGISTVPLFVFKTRLPSVPVPPAVIFQVPSFSISICAPVLVTIPALGL